MSLEHWRDTPRARPSAAGSPAPDDVRHVLEELTARVRALAIAPGRSATALPGMWLFRADRPGTFSRARAPMMYLAVAVSGMKAVRVGNLSLANDRLHFLVLRGETDYEAAVARATPAAPYIAVGLQLPPEVVARTLLDLAEDERAPRPSGPGAPALVGTLDAPLAGAVMRLLDCLDDPAERRIVAPLCLREIVFRLLRTPAAAVIRAAALRGEKAKIGRAIAFIEKKLPRRLSVATIAKTAAMSPSHFAHRFRALVGLSPMQYVKMRRLEQARGLLLELAPVSGAADRVGYASASQFARDFKRHYGIAPSVYARAFLSNSLVPLDVPLANPRGVSQD